MSIESLNKYQTGKIFYQNKIDDLVKKAECVKNPYEALENTDERELMELKLKQLKRREVVLERLPDDLS